MKKIISYCLYGKDPRYLEGLVHNSNLAVQYYPDWTIRLYTDYPTDNKDLIDIKNGHPNLDIIYQSPEIGHKFMFNRFDVLADKTIDFVISRDLDSRLGHKEMYAVHEWIDSNKSFHIMRDNVEHRVPILGGMWGASNKFISKIADKYFTMKTNYFNSLDFNTIHGNKRGQYFNVDQPF